MRVGSWQVCSPVTKMEAVVQFHIDQLEWYSEVSFMAARLNKSERE